MTASSEPAPVERSGATTAPSAATLAELEAALRAMPPWPRDRGRVELIVRRPREDVRETPIEAELDPREGLVGDNWSQRPSRRTADGSPHPDMQLTLMNADVAALVAKSPERRALAGDQLLVDLDLSAANLPPGTRLRVGTAVIEVTEQPHTGCGKFRDRFGADALRFVNSPEGRALNLRGINARVVAPGVVRLGDAVCIDAPKP